MENLSHDECYGTDKTTQKSGYGELTRKIPPLEKGDTGGFLKSPLTPLYERGGVPSPLCGEGQVEGENTPSAWRRHPSERGELTEQRRG